jgi:type IV secretory pathway TrbL component
VDQKVLTAAFSGQYTQQSMAQSPLAVFTLPSNMASSTATMFRLKGNNNHEGK